MSRVRLRGRPAGQHLSTGPATRDRLYRPTPAGKVNSSLASSFKDFLGGADLRSKGRDLRDVLCRRPYGEEHLWCLPSLCKCSTFRATVLNSLKERLPNDLPPVRLQCHRW